jgi:hypothetical protein
MKLLASTECPSVDSGLHNLPKVVSVRPNLSGNASVSQSLSRRVFRRCQGVGKMAPKTVESPGENAYPLEFERIGNSLTSKSESTVWQSAASASEHDSSATAILDPLVTAGTT